MYFYEGCTLKEVQAMRELQGEPFDFGSGLITVDCKESEDVYMKMHLQIFYDWMDYDTLDCNIDTDEFTKDMTRGKRRKNNWKKAIRKKKHSFIGEDRPLNHFNKGKGFCSCNMCTIKTNPKGKNVRSSHNGVKVNYKQRNWKSSDRKKVDRCGYSLKEYYSKDDFNYDEWSFIRMQAGIVETYEYIWEEYLEQLKREEDENIKWNEKYYEEYGYFYEDNYFYE